MRGALDSLSKVRNITIVALVSVLIIAIGSFYYYIKGLIPLSSDGIIRLAWTGQYTNSNEVAYTLSIFLPILILHFIYKQISTPKRIVLLPVILLLLVDIFLTGSRAAYLSIFSMYFYLLSMSKNRVQLLLITVPVIFLIFLFNPEGHLDRFFSTADNLDASAQGRLDAWKAGLSMAFDRPLYGVGIGCFNIAYASYKGVWLTSHNTFISLLAETGFFGALFFLLVMWQGFRNLSHIQKTLSQTSLTQEWIPILNGLKASYVVFLIFCLFNDLQFDQSTTFIIGITIALNQLSKKPRDITVNKSP
jgi:O-antigen ligase